MKRKIRTKLSMWKFLSLGYLIVILTGSALLSLPFATSADAAEKTTYLNALFTATSATCVTGLTPYAVGTHWSLFGQIVILLLIQLGGLGFMTFVSVILITFKHMGLQSRETLLTSAGGNKRSGTMRLLMRIFVGTLIFEVLGSCLLMIRFIPQYGAGRGIYFSIFHSVSAFCNAGFDLMSAVGGESLINYATDPLVVITVCALVFMGGLGFCVWSDVIDCKLNPKKFQLNTKTVLIVSCALLVAGTGFFLLFERNNPQYSNYNFGQKLLASLFNAVTMRTAGFFTTPPDTLSESGYALSLILMFIGGASGSTAGGIKVGTFVVIIMGMLATFRGRRDINIGKKRIEYTLLSQALAIFAACFMLLIIAATTMCAIEPVQFKVAIYDCVSALGTVGLSFNSTPEWGIGAKIILIILMYTGRVGILTLALALGEKRTQAEIRKPVDKLLIG